MHELSICQALLSQLAEIVSGRGAVARVVIEVGPLSGVEPVLLASAFEIMRAGSCAARAALVIESTAVEISCMRCCAQSQVAANRLICPACGGFRTRIVAGDELRLRRFELCIPEPQPASAA